ncbi:Por secretion system C-terminal sorting domain-containing protein [Flavobacterium aquidurense]|uniref:Secretion system C-terminal sorting domain-containing protein n=1 Tax=Flavobacterium frigidimaris TaxID=262320 RepID=A0ABX4BPE2_FLAFR|nr:T9SS type A sorting domain-containing protein [Flavobacterium frigidimaris]OXA77954.1 hypothetical protein B0A65_14400 [Flavobacterium frigidimaris]SDZ61250.1 Por secretion system C-terminal sorting domain-containing protein [Flavobacterium aquidurense]
MKKTLLCFLFLFTTVFYAQVSDIVHCPGDNNFDLAKQKPLLIGNLNPDETTVSFHLSLTAALNNTNPIANPSNYNAAVGATTIYVRIDNNENITTNSFNIKVVAALNITATHTAILCAGDKSSLTVTATGGVGPYYYALNAGSFSSSPVFTNLSAGVYSIQVLDTGTSCPTTANYTITAPIAVTATSRVLDQNTILITAAGGTAPYQYSLDGLTYQAANYFTNFIPGNYDVRIKDVQGCVAVVKATVAPFLNAAVAIRELDCTGNGNNAQLNITAFGGQAPYLYSVDNGYTYQTFNIFNNLSAGTYSVTVKDALNSVTNPNLITIAQPVAVNGVALVTNATSCTGASMMVHATSGQSPFYYSIDNGQTFTNSNIFNNLTPGNYTFLIKDSKGCVSPPLFNMVQQPPAPLLATASSTPLVCAKDKTILTINATGGQSPYQYAINNGGFTAANTYNVAGGTYFITVKDAVGCIVSIEHIIAQPTPIYPDIVIEGQTLTLNGQAGTAPYQYSVDLAAYQTENVFTNLSAGNHIVHVKDSKGCESYDFIVTIENPSPVTFTYSTIKQADCSGKTQIILAAAGGQGPYYYSLSYSMSGTSYQSGNIFSKVPPGTYYLTVKDALNSVSSTSQIIISPPVAVTATATSTPILCAGETASLTVTALSGEAPFEYSINGGTYTNVNTFTKLKAGNYIITVKDSNSCLVSLSHTIVEPEILFGDLLVEGSTVSVIDVKGGTGSYQYAIGTGDFQANNVFTNLAPGYYQIRLKDSTNCEPVRFEARVAAPLTSVSTVTKQLDCVSNAEITVNAKGGYDPYQYSINDGLTYQSTPSFTNIPAGTYSVKVKDAADNISNSNEILINALVPVIATATSTPLDCTNYNATITINATGGQPPYQYSVNNEAYTSTITYTTVSPGTYTISVRDANFCVNKFVHVIAPLENILGTINIEGQTATVVSVSGGSGFYLYSLDEGSVQTSPVFTNVTPGHHLIKIKDSTGCESPYPISFSIEQPNSLTSTVAITKTIDCTSNASIAITAAGGQIPYTYSIDGGITYQSTNTFTNIPGGTYTVTVKDANNDTKTSSFIIPPYSSSLTVSGSYKNVSCNGSNDGSAEIIASGGKAPYLYSINNSVYTSSATFSSLAAGDYTLNVIDAAGCPATSLMRITQPDPIFVTSSVKNTTASNNDGEITVIATGGAGSYTYAITDNFGLPTGPFQISNVFKGLKVGSYGVQVKDTNGCAYSKANITIASNPNPLLVTFATTPATCVNPVGTVTVTASGGTAPYNYSLNGGSYASLNVFNLAPGTYTITVRDAGNNLSSIVADVTQVSVPSITAAVTSNILCKGDNTGSVTAVAIGGKAPYSYSINGVTFSPANTFTNLRIGTFTITVRDANSCLATTMITLTEPSEALSATAFPANDQSIIVNAKGGTGPYQYFLQDKGGVVVAGPQDNGVFTRLPLGLYGAQVTDANGCGYIMSGINVIPSPPLSATADVLAATCANSGTITVNATGGFQPYYYSFDNGVTYTNSNVYSTFLPGNYTIKVRDYKNTIVSLTAAISQINAPAITATATNIKCKGGASGSITATISGGQAPYTYSLNNGVFTTNSGNSISFYNLQAGVYSITVKDAKGCLTTNQIVITEPASPLISGITVQNQTITIEPSGGAGGYKFALSPNLDKFSTNNVFSQLNPGPYTVITSDLNGCSATINVLVDPPSPVINGLNKFEIELKPGLTLADIVVNGQNIRWYMNLNITDGSTSKTKETPLPLSTVLVDGTTYYASQTINGIESKERLAVTVKLNGALSTPDFVLPNFTFYPNPVLHTLTISNTAVIDEIEIYSVSGTTVLSKKVDNDYSEIDLSNVASGMYFLKVKSEGKTKTVKIVKK